MLFRGEPHMIQFEFESGFRGFFISFACTSHVVCSFESLAFYHQRVSKGSLGCFDQFGSSLISQRFKVESHFTRVNHQIDWKARDS